MQRSVLTVFLASPSDLAEERKIVRNTVDRINKAFGRKFNWHIELLGWEDTLPGFARPQSLINKDVDACDLFVGMLWRRWGHPTGEFSSGFEEEFLRARDRRRKSSKPEIWLFFKTIDEDISADPGEQLKKVLKFRNEQIRNKELLFKDFKDEKNFSDLIYDDLSAYLADLAFPSKELPLQEISAPPAKEPEKPTETTEGRISYPSDIISLLGKINSGIPIKGSSTLDFWDRVRLFLISSAWFSEKHQGEIFGVHEINLVFTQRKAWNLSEDEKSFLIRSIVGDTDDLRPGWYWVKDQNKEYVDKVLTWLAINDPSAIVRKRAFLLLTNVNHVASRELLMSGVQDNDEIVLQAIDLLRKNRNKDNLELLDDVLNSDNSQIKKSAISTHIELLYQDNPNGAFIDLIEKGTEVPPLIKNTINDLSLKVDEELLIRAINEAGPSIRYFAAEYLLKSKRLTKDICHNLLSDSDSFVRKIGLLGLIEQGEPVDIEMARKLFPEPKIKERGLAVLFRVRADDFIPLILERRDPRELLSSLDFFNNNSDDAYRILAVKNFKILETRIRNDLENEFENLRLESIDRFKERYGEQAETFLKMWSPFVERIRSKHIAAGLEGLAENGVPDDVKYARKYLGETVDNLADDGAIKLLSRFGSSSDVEGLLKIAPKVYGETKLAAVQTALKLSKSKDKLLSQLIQHEDGSIAKIAAKELLSLNPPERMQLAKELLSFESDEMRLIGAAILVKNCTDDELNKVLEEYLVKKSYYYNVITWIDRILFAPEPYKKIYRDQLLKKIEP